MEEKTDLGKKVDKMVSEKMLALDILKELNNGLRNSGPVELQNHGFNVITFGGKAYVNKTVEGSYLLFTKEKSASGEERYRYVG